MAETQTGKTAGEQQSVRTIRIALAVLMAALLSAGIYISGLVLERQSALERLSRYNVAFSAGQGANEFLRFRNALYDLARSDTPDKEQQARLRFEILMNRLSLFNAGEFKEFIAADPEQNLPLNKIEQTLTEVDQLIDQPQGIRRALSLTNSLESLFVGLASEANAYGGKLVTRDQQDLFRLHWQFTTVAISLAACGFVLFLINGWQNRLLISTQSSLASSNEDLQRTSAQLAAAVAETRNANAKLVDQNELFETALDNMSHGLCMFNSDGNVIVTNRRMAQIFDLPLGAIKPGTTLAELEHLLVEQKICSPSGAASLLKMSPGAAKSMARHTAEQTLADGRRVLASHQPMESGGWTATFEDITERYKAQAQISHMARHDALTDLPNRTLLRERLEQSLAQDRSSATFTAVMCIDLDNFKKINDTYGHPFGDLLLREASERLRASCRNTDTISRVGGDEFIIVYGGVADVSQTSAVARRMLQALSEPYRIEGREVVSDASIGIATSCETAGTVDDLLRYADLALYAAKNAGRGTFVHYTAEMGTQIERKAVIESKLRSIDLSEKFELAYQPITDLATGKVVCVEALMRWNPQEEENIASPQEIIRIAEETGAIVELGAWGLREACRLATELPKEIDVAVNLSAVQFNRTDIVKTISDILRETGLSPQRLNLEITETLLLEDNTKIMADLKIIKDLGASLSLDDFGTGYSSLNYLRKFAVDKIKIDRIFIKEIGRNRNHDAIVAAIVNLASSLGMTTIAEGVETMDQLQILRAAGCGEIQGFLISPPLFKNELFSYLASLPRNRAFPKSVSDTKRHDVGTELSGSHR